MTTYNDKLVAYELMAELDDCSVRGNAMASDDDAFDKQVEDEIIRRLADGDVWAWAIVRVRATYRGVNGVYGDDYLGCCNYADENDFRSGGYYDDMCFEARVRLYEQLDAIRAVLC